jgi:hypothetical protein
MVWKVRGHVDRVRCWKSPFFEYRMSGTSPADALSAGVPVPPPVPAPTGTASSLTSLLPTSLFVNPLLPPPATMAAPLTALVQPVTCIPATGSIQPGILHAPSVQGLLAHQTQPGILSPQTLLQQQQVLATAVLAGIIGDGSEKSCTVLKIMQHFSFECS